MYKQGLDTASQTITFVCYRVSVTKRLFFVAPNGHWGGYGSERKC